VSVNAVFTCLTVRRGENPEGDADEEGVGGDDAADALRYLVATKSRTIVERKLRVL